MSDAAITSIVTGVVTIVTLMVGFLTLWIRLKYGIEGKTDSVSKKLDDNTQLTKNARDEARVSAMSATTTRETVEDINRKLNGGIDSAVLTAVAPLHTALEEKIETKLKELTDYVHQRNHDFLNVLGEQNNKVSIIMHEIKQLKQQLDKGD